MFRDTSGFRHFSLAVSCPDLPVRTDFPFYFLCPGLPVRADFPFYFLCPGLPVRADFPPYFHCTRPARSRRLSALFPLHQTCPFAQTFRLISAAPACPLAQTFRLIPSPCRFLPSDFFDICLDKEFP
ncbi:MAG: hypothetical protein BHW56_06500 [Acetobacter sp. 46_36]|nr:MAG: hypothetical protein BHW56_06500 [Acetobacter sp. 46_36]